MKSCVKWFSGRFSSLSRSGLCGVRSNLLTTSPTSSSWFFSSSSSSSGSSSSSATSFPINPNVTTKNPPRQTIGMIGLGKIGHAMATNFIHRGQLNVLAYDIDRTQTARFYDQQRHTNQCAIASNVGEIMDQCDLIVTVLPNDAILKSCVMEDMLPYFKGKETSSTSGSSSSKVHISCSTVSPQTAQDLYELQQSKSGRQFDYMSAPVFARPDGMIKAQAYIPISGNLEHMTKCTNLLEHTSTQVYGFGPDVRSACVVKLCGNFLIASAIESMSEAFTLGEKLGVSRVQMAQFFSETIFNCLIYKGYGERVSTRNHIPWKDAHFSLQLGHKDLNLVLNTANQINVPMPVANLLHDRFLSAMSQGWQDLDWSAIALTTTQDVGDETTVQECIDKCRHAKEMKLQ